MFNWSSIDDRGSVGSDLDVTLSSYSVEIILDALALMHDRWRWGGVDDSTWDTIDDAVSNAEGDILAGL